MKRILLVLLSVLVVCAFSACSTGEGTMGKVEISCGREGFGPSTHCYGIFYSVADHYNAVFDSEFPLEEFKASGHGYVWNSDDTDNRYYAEPLGNHFFYYEAHF